MIYPADFEARIGFDQIRHRIMQYCVGEPGRRNVAAISFMRVPALIKRFLFQNHEAHHLLDQGYDLPVHPYYDPSAWFDKAAIEGDFLESLDFLKIRNALENI